MASTDRSGLGSFYAVSTAVVVLLVVVIVLTVETLAVAVALALVALYVLHLLSLRRILRAQEEQWETFRGLLDDFRRERDAAEDVAREDRQAQRLRESLWRGGAPAPAGPGPRASASTGPAPDTPAPDRASASREGTARRGDAVTAPGAAGAEAPEAASPDAEGSAAEGSAAEDVVIPRQFALGTVALIRKKMEPAEIARVLERQREQPDEFFGELAVELGYLEEGELDGLLRDQRRGLFRDAEIRQARERLQRYRRQAGDEDQEG